SHHRVPRISPRAAPGRPAVRARDYASRARTAARAPQGVAERRRPADRHAHRARRLVYADALLLGHHRCLRSAGDHLARAARRRLRSGRARRRARRLLGVPRAQGALISPRVRRRPAALSPREAPALAYITTLKQPGVCAIVSTTHARSTAP